MVKHSSSKNGLNLDKTSQHPSGVNQIGGYVVMSLASAEDKGDVMNSICMDNPDVLVA